MLKVQEFYKKYKELLALEGTLSEVGFGKSIKVAEVERPGLALTGFLKWYSQKRLLVFGRGEMEYLRELSDELRFKRLEEVLSVGIPCVIVTRNLKPFPEMQAILKERQIALFRTQLATADVMRKLTVCLGEEFAPKMSTHACLVEAFGLGILIQGDSSVGKSEAALGLIERGHRLVSDDIVILKRREGFYLEGEGPELTKHMLEIRGIGIINVAHLYGAVCVSEKARIDLVVRIEEWDSGHFYDRIGLEEKFLEFLHVKVPFYMLPVKPGRDVVLLLETVVLNHRLKQRGYHSAKEFNVKLLDTIRAREKRKSSIS